MNLSPLLILAKEIQQYNLLLKDIVRDNKRLNLPIVEAAKPYLVAALHQDIKSPTLIITTQPKETKRIYDELQVWCPESTPIYLFPESDTLPDEDAPTDMSVLSRRLQIITALSLRQNNKSDNQKLPLMIASTLAAASKTLNPQDFLNACKTLTKGMTLNLTQLLTELATLGYEMEETVEVPGTVSRRGGIIDIYPLSNELPVRIEFFNNQIETIRLFNPQTQKSLKLIPSITIIPAKETVWKQPGQSPTSVSCLLDYLTTDALVIVDNPDDVRNILEEKNNKVEGLNQDNSSLYLFWAEFQQKINKTNKYLALWPRGDGESGPAFRQPLPFTSVPSYGGKLNLVIEDIKVRPHEKERVVIVSHQANRLSEILLQEDIMVSVSNEIKQNLTPGSIILLQGSLSAGWTLKNAVRLFSDTEIFGFVKQHRLLKKHPVRRQWSLYQLLPGDFVVHIEHGIGKFFQLSCINLEGITREYLVLEYAAGDRLYVPTDQIDRVSRYIGASDQPPALSRLGTQEWVKTKQKIKQSVAIMAEDLLKLYASREVVAGFAYTSDSIWQQELEASFPYVETPDQMETIQAIKNDMEQIKPMDRLVCGDVGYGKTEVALRTAFKAAMDNKQTALLVPTTVLAQQHFNTFKERLQAFPIRVEMLSRFCSEKEQGTILEGIATGIIDICIGTHRLLQKDITFKNLGLVIIDEEQRFGVIHKERLKQLRHNVDILTLSATPIPRTLHMSLAGIKDMSVMETPPEERLPIKTYVGPYDERLIHDAITRELNRNGQVFFVHNRVQSIMSVANRLKELVPKARIAVAHGQMLEEELEEMMMDFATGEKDILVSTIIIESGLDMPNVNTLIVNQSDRLGLSQLYQLRGRVGRGVERAYAYFLFDKGKRLTPQAQKRLRTIFEATELGAGFGIAMKDLEIRGAGNLLGVEQSGHIAAVGFDLFCRLLAEAVEELRSKQAGKIQDKKAELPTPTINLPVPAYLPEEYMPSLATRISLYHRLTKIEHSQQIIEFTEELKDRFGALPQPVKNLLEILDIKLLSINKGVESITAEAKQIVINLAPGRNLEDIALIPSRNGVRIGTDYIRIDMKRLGNEWLKSLKTILEGIAVT